MQSYVNKQQLSAHKSKFQSTSCNNTCTVFTLCAAAVLVADLFVYGNAFADWPLYLFAGFFLQVKLTYKLLLTLILAKQLLYDSLCMRQELLNSSPYIVEIADVTIDKYNRTNSLGLLLLSIATAGLVCFCPALAPWKYTIDVALSALLPVAIMSQRVLLLKKIKSKTRSNVWMTVQSLINGKLQHKTPNWDVMAFSVLVLLLMLFSLVWAVDMLTWRKWLGLGNAYSLRRHCHQYLQQGANVEIRLLCFLGRTNIGKYIQLKRNGCFELLQLV